MRAASTTATAATLNLIATDGVGVTGYYLSTSSTPPSAGVGSWVAVTATTSYSSNVSYTLSSGDGTKTVYAWYKDAAGNVSATASASILLDQTAPSNGTLTATAGNGQVALSWSGFSDGGSGLASSNTYKLVFSTSSLPAASCTNGTQLLLGTATTYTHTGLTNGTTYYYRACAFDTAGNVSTGATASATPQAPDTTAPTAPSSLSATAASSSQINLSWTAATDAVGVTGYRVERCQGAGCSSFSQVATPTGTSSSDTGLLAGTSYSYRVRATDAAGNLSGYSNTASATTAGTADTTAPTAPSSLSATAASSSQINLSWTAATDTVGVTGYRVERCQGAGCSSFSQVATPTGTSSSDTGLQAGTSYSYRVRATDAAGNLSGYSNTATGTTAAPAPTSGPASLTVRTLAGTKIYLGGNPAHLGDLKGTVPENGELSIQGLVAKKYVIRATLAGFLDAYRQVSLDPGANVVSLEMAPFNSSDTLSPTLTTLEAGGAAIRGGGQDSAPFVVDWDNDGKKDLLVGGGDGAVVLYQNVGSDAAPQFGASQAVMADNAPISVLGPASVFVVDWDSDGNKDLLVGDGQGRVRWYRNTGTDDTPILTAWGPLLAGGVEIQVTGPAAPVVVDWNSDGRKDLLVGDGAGRVWLFLNQGTDAAPVLATGVRFRCLTWESPEANARPFVVDWNEDGRKDLLVGRCEWADLPVPQHRDGRRPGLRQRGSADRPRGTDRRQLQCRPLRGGLG